MRIRNTDKYWPALASVQNQRLTSPRLYRVSPNLSRPRYEMNLSCPFL